MTESKTMMESKTMTDEEFEIRWLKNRQRLLNADKEYKALTEGYRISSGADLLLFGLPVITGIVAVDTLPIESELFRWLATAGIVIAAFVLAVWVKSLILGSKSASDIEKRIKEQYRKSLNPNG